MQMFRAIDGKFYSMSQVVRAGERRKITFFHHDKGGARHEREGEVVEIDLVGDLRIEVEAYEYDSWGRLPVTSFAAAPGTVILHRDEGEPNGYFTTPVLGWAVGADEVIYPVTTFGVNDGNGHSHDVLLPTGEVVAFESTTDSLQAWLESEEAKKRA